MHDLPMSAHRSVVTLDLQWNCLVHCNHIRLPLIMPALLPMGNQLGRLRPLLRVQHAKLSTQTWNCERTFSPMPNQMINLIVQPRRKQTNLMNVPAAERHAKVSRIKAANHHTYIFARAVMWMASFLPSYSVETSSGKQRSKQRRRRKPSGPIKSLCCFWKAWRCTHPTGQQFHSMSAHELAMNASCISSICHWKTLTPWPPCQN